MIRKDNRKRYFHKSTQREIETIKEIERWRERDKIKERTR